MGHVRCPLGHVDFTTAISAVDLYRRLHYRNISAASYLGCMAILGIIPFSEKACVTFQMCTNTGEVEIAGLSDENTLGPTNIV